MLKIVHLLSVIFATCGLGQVPRAKESEFAALRDGTFEAAWEQVGKTYYDATFGGLDWDEIGREYRRKVAEAGDMQTTRGLISEMLYKLGDSHLALLSSDFEKEDLVKPWLGGWAGVDLCYKGDRLIFFRIDPLGSAYEAGVRNGDMLVSVNGIPPKEVRKALTRSGIPRHVLKYSTLTSVLSHFRGSTDEIVTLRVRSPKQPVRDCEIKLTRYTGLTTEPFGQIGRLPLELDTEVLDGGAGYMRFNLWFPAVMPRLREFIGDLPSDGPGLVIDLRGNPGGMMAMAGGLSGMLLHEQSALGRTTLREGHLNVVGFPQKNAFLGKVAVLVNEASVSTSEVFAIGLQELGRVRVFGQRTPGAALPSVITSLPNGDSLQIAMGDFKTPKGVSLEGRGVEPDRVVSISPIDLSEGIDTVLVVALNWIYEDK